MYSVIPVYDVAKRYAKSHPIQDVRLTSIQVSSHPHTGPKINVKYLDLIAQMSRVLKMNAVAHAQLTFEMFPLLQTYLYHQSQYSNTWGTKCLALIAQMVNTGAGFLCSQWSLGAPILCTWRSSHSRHSVSPSNTGSHSKLIRNM